MPIISTVTQKQVKVQQEAMEKLLWKCEESNLFKKSAEQVWCYYVCGDYATDDGPAMVAIAKFGNVYAMRTPEYLTEKQLVVFEFVLRDAEPQDEIVVFSKKDYDAVMKYKYSKEIKKVTLCK